MSNKDEAMQVDLSKAKAGDTVKFRCGGRAVIEEINTAHDPIVQFVGGGMHNYALTGASRLAGLLDITEVIPAPVAFDWKDAKWGMVYKSHDNQLWAYVGQNPYNKERSVFVAHVNGHYVVEWGKDEAKLTRAPEHDVMEKE